MRCTASAALVDSAGNRVVGRQRSRQRDGNTKRSAVHCRRICNASIAVQVAGDGCFFDPNSQSKQQSVGEVYPDLPMQVWRLAYFGASVRMNETARACRHGGGLAASASPEEQQHIRSRKTMQRRSREHACGTKIQYALHPDLCRLAPPHVTYPHPPPLRPPLFSPLIMRTALAQYCTALVQHCAPHNRNTHNSNTCLRLFTYFCHACRDGYGLGGTGA